MAQAPGSQARTVTRLAFNGEWGAILGTVAALIDITNPESPVNQAFPIPPVLPRPTIECPTESFRGTDPGACTPPWVIRATAPNAAWVDRRVRVHERLIFPEGAVPRNLQQSHGRRFADSGTVASPSPSKDREPPRIMPNWRVHPCCRQRTTRWWTYWCSYEANESNCDLAQHSRRLLQ